VGEVAIAVWDVLAQSYRDGEGAMRATEVMRASELSRSEAIFGPRELVQGGWVRRTLVRRNGKMLEAWQPAERHAGYGRRPRVMQEAAE
jgi:hypothetical protein